LLPGDEFQAQITAGRGMTTRQAVAEALRELGGGTSVTW